MLVFAPFGDFILFPAAVPDWEIHTHTYLRGRTIFVKPIGNTNYTKLFEH